MRATSLKSVRGFSLIELMAVLLIAAILVALVVPGFTALIRANRAKVQASSVINSINFARAEAVKRAVDVRITQLVAGNWQGGWRVWVDSNADASYTAGTDIELQVYPAFAGEATLTSTASALVFDKFGNASGVAPGTPVDLAYRLGEPYCKLERNISINHLGRATISHRTDCQ